MTSLGLAYGTTAPTRPQDLPASLSGVSGTDWWVRKPWNRVASDERFPKRGLAEEGAVPYRCRR